MALTDITDIFTGADITDFELTIASGDLVSCPNPVSSDPNEIVFGLLETMYQGISNAAEPPTYLKVGATSNLIGGDIYRRTYTFTVDLDFDGDNIIEGLDVKDEPVE